MANEKYDKVWSDVHDEGPVKFCLKRQESAVEAMERMAAPLPGTVHQMPKNWRELEWHSLEMKPCYSGGDALLAYDEKVKIGYAVFDQWCNAWSSESFDSFVDENRAIECGRLEADYAYARPKDEVETVDVRFEA